MEILINKKRIAGIMCLIIILGFMISPLVYADGEKDMDANAGAQSAKELKLTQSYPEDKDNHLQLENTGIKLFFDGNVIDKSVWNNNKTKFSLKTKKGKTVPVRAYASKKSGTNYILLVTDSGNQLKSNSEYVFTIKEGITSTDGKVMPSNITLNYKTVDMEGNTRINMGLMAVMVVGMIVMTTISTRRQARKESNQKEEKVNPYKIAKETGKSVEEVMAQIEKDRARKAKKAQKKLESGNDDDYDDDDDLVYKVKSPRPISAGGSTYKTGRKAAAEKKAKAEAAKKAKGTTNPKNKSGKKKGKSKKK